MKKNSKSESNYCNNRVSIGELMTALGHKSIDTAVKYAENFEKGDSAEFDRKVNRWRKTFAKYYYRLD